MRALRAVLAVLTAGAVWLVAVVATALATANLGGAAQLAETSGQVLWTAVPQAVTSLLMVVAAGLVLGRDRVAASWAGAGIAAGPAVLQLVAVTVAGALGDAAWQVVVFRCAAGAAAVAVGWWLVAVVGRR
ncbi:hypothetical protein [Nocardiopsis trehalosi]|jgi:hypothetical protein|uniref:hypothetical protein n=1 Tax=Nocardiopsis trehalosi TaxID=109329 RepID=UPI000A636526|nr:hypothetical protein [Nocardiopsis trehalosi]